MWSVFIYIIHWIKYATWKIVGRLQSITNTAFVAQTEAESEQSSYQMEEDIQREENRQVRSSPASPWDGPTHGLVSQVYYGRITGCPV